MEDLSKKIENNNLSEMDTNLYNLKKCILDFCIKNNINNIEVGLITDPVDNEVIDCNITISYC